jgi:hypothetical protein
MFCFIPFQLAAILPFSLLFYFSPHQQPSSGPPQLPQQTVKTFTPANPPGLKNPEQYQQANTLGSQLYTASKLETKNFHLVLV